MPRRSSSAYEDGSYGLPNPFASSSRRNANAHETAAYFGHRGIPQTLEPQTRATGYDTYSYQPSHHRDHHHHHSSSHQTYQYVEPDRYRRSDAPPPPSHRSYDHGHSTHGGRASETYARHELHAQAERLQIAARREALVSSDAERYQRRLQRDAVIDRNNRFGDRIQMIEEQGPWAVRNARDSADRVGMARSVGRRWEEEEAEREDALQYHRTVQGQEGRARMAADLGRRR